MNIVTDFGWVGHSRHRAYSYYEPQAPHFLLSKQYHSARTLQSLNEALHSGVNSPKRLTLVEAIYFPRIVDGLFLRAMTRDYEEYVVIPQEYRDSRTHNGIRDGRLLWILELIRRLRRTLLVIVSYTCFLKVEEE